MEIEGQRIRQLREERGYSLADFASRAGISVSYLSEIERGAKKPTLKMLDRLAGSLNVTKTQIVRNGPREKEEDNALTLGDRLRTARQEKGFSLSEVASKVGISSSYLSEIERNNVRPAVQTLQRISRALRVAATSLIGPNHTLGDKVRQIRQQQGLTQAQLAHQAGLSPGLIGQIEHGRVQPSLQTLEKIAGVLGTSTCYFVLEDDAGPEDMLRLLSPDVRRLLQDENVQAVLRLVCNCTEREMRFILDFIKIYKRQGIEVGAEIPE